MAGNIYESDRLVREYLLFHYGSAEEILPWSGGPRDALDFAIRCVDELLDASALTADARALDVGCAVGRSAFQLARHCRQVVGVDYSRAFIEAAETIRSRGSLPYEYTVEGERSARAIARSPSDVDVSCISFEAGDAMNLRESLEGFDVVLAANLLCRLPEPNKFLARLPSLVRPGGQLLLTTPFTWLEEYTPHELWIGGRGDVSCADALKELLSPHFELRHEKNIPFLIREHSRKFQWSVAWGTRWIKK